MQLPVVEYSKYLIGVNVFRYQCWVGINVHFKKNCNGWQNASGMRCLIDVHINVKYCNDYISRWSVVVMGWNGLKRFFKVIIWNMHIGICKYYTCCIYKCIHYICICKCDISGAQMAPWLRNQPHVSHHQYKPIYIALGLIVCCSVSRACHQPVICIQSVQCDF